MILFSLFLYYKITIEPVTQDFYGDREKPLTAYYIQNGNDYVHVKGNYDQKNESLELGGKEGGDATWEFTINILDWADSQTRKSFVKTLYISPGTPYSAVKGRHVRIFVNNHLIAEVTLTKQVYLSNQILYTWELPISELRVLHDPFWQKNVIKWNISQEIQYKMRIGISLDRSVVWTIEKVILGLDSDPNSITLPWWQKNFFVTTIIVVGDSIGLVVLIFLVKRYISAESANIDKKN